MNNESKSNHVKRVNVKCQMFLRGSQNCSSEATLDEIAASEKQYCRLCDVKVDMAEPKKHFQSDLYKERNYLFAFSFLNMKPLENGSVRCMACAKDYRSLKLFMLHCQTPHHRATLELQIVAIKLFFHKDYSGNVQRLEK